MRDDTCRGDMMIASSSRMMTDFNGLGMSTSASSSSLSESSSDADLVDIGFPTAGWPPLKGKGLI